MRSVARGFTVERGACNTHPATADLKMSSTIPLQEDQLIELLLQLKVSSCLYWPIAPNHTSAVAEDHSRPSKSTSQLSTTDCICTARPHGQDGRDRHPNISGLTYPPLPSLDI
jgi:hypothetical protein